MLKSSSLCLYSSNLGTFWLKIEQFWSFEDISIFSNGSHLGWRAWLSDTILKGQELLTLPEHLSSPAVFSGVRVTRSLILYVCFVDRCLSFCTF
jgi:hypothetical protein